MSLQWKLVATFLYTEIALCGLLLLPFISPSRWQKIFKSRLLGFIRSHANIYFNFFILILLLLFVDSIRDVRRYMGEEEDTPAIPTAEMSLHMKLFRAQRNFYIALFALTLSVVLRRLVVLISEQAQLIASNEAVTKQAQSASDMAKRLMEEKDNAAESKENAANEKDADTVEEMAKTKKDLEHVREELRHASANLEAMKSQAESTKTEYDRLLGEHSKLQDQLKALEGSEGSKKDD